MRIPEDEPITLKYIDDYIDLLDSLDGVGIIITDYDEFVSALLNEGFVFMPDSPLVEQYEHLMAGTEAAEEL